jgi:gamma-glutamyl:cysteine ligase YbdK (ATP-grasp superfamily)
VTITFGVEEEFLLIDGSNQLASAAPDVLQRSNDVAGELQPEMVTCQIRVCHPDLSGG